MLINDAVHMTKMAGLACTFMCTNMYMYKYSLQILNEQNLKKNCGFQKRAPAKAGSLYITKNSASKNAVEK